MIIEIQDNDLQPGDLLRVLDVDGDTVIVTVERKEPDPPALGVRVEDEMRIDTRIGG